MYVCLNLQKLCDNLSTLDVANIAQSRKSGPPQTILQMIFWGHYSPWIDTHLNFQIIFWGLNFSWIDTHLDLSLLLMHLF